MMEQDARLEDLQSLGIDEFSGDWEELMSELNRHNQWSNPERLAAVRESIENMSGEARTVVCIVLNAPKELTDFIRQRPSGIGMTRHSLWDYLRWYGFKCATIRKAFSEIEFLLEDLENDIEEVGRDREEDRKLVNLYFAAKDMGINP